MKASAAFLIAFSLSLQAQTPADSIRKEDKKPHREERKDRPFAEGINQVDLDKDGKLSKTEFLQLKRISQIPADKQDKLFTRLDKNADGFIQHEELAFSPMESESSQKGQISRPFPHLAQLDTNQDKQISFEEFSKSPGISRLPAERQRTIFDNMDRNKDGFLSPKDRPDGQKRPFPPGPHGGPNDKAAPPHNKPGQPQNFRQAFADIDTNKNGDLDFAEFQASPMMKNMGEDAQEDRYEAIDTNKDLKISEAEWQQQPMRKPSDAPKPPSKKSKPDKPSDDDEMMME